MSTDSLVSCVSVAIVRDNRAVRLIGETIVKKASVHSENKTGGRMSIPTPAGCTSASWFFVLRPGVPGKSCFMLLAAALRTRSSRNLTARRSIWSSVVPSAELRRMRAPKRFIFSGISSFGAPVS